MSEDISLIVCERSGDRITHLPEGSIGNIAWELVEPGSFDISIHPLSEGAEEIALVKREIQVWEGSDLIHWGVPWSVEGGVGQITFQCEGVLSLFKKRYIDRMSMDYLSIDQIAIAWDLLSYAQDESVQGNRDLNISASNFAPSGVPRSPRYDREQHQNILDIVREFPDMDNGFEYSIQLDPGGHERFWTPHYPRKGSYKAEYHMRWEVGKSRNISTFTWNETALPLLTHAYVTGGSNGEIKFEQNYEDITASHEYGVMQEVISDGDQKDVGWLLDRAKKEVRDRKRTLISTEITSVTSEDLKRGDIVEGDWLRVTIDYGRIQADSLYRVKSVNVNPQGKITYGFDGELVAA